MLDWFKQLSTARLYAQWECSSDARVARPATRAENVRATVMSRQVVRDPNRSRVGAEERYMLRGTEEKPCFKPFFFFLT